jgi:cytochrome P450
MRMLAEHRVRQISCIFQKATHLLTATQGLQQTLRQQILSLSPTDRLDPHALAQLPTLTATIYETLRLYPPISQLMNRRTEADVLLGDSILLKKGTYCGYNGYTTNRDTSAWGPDSHAFRPERWGETPEQVQTLFRKSSAKSTFISFHGGRRTCLGIKFAMVGARLSLSKMLTSLEWQLDPAWPRRMTPVSSTYFGCEDVTDACVQAGPLMPRALQLQFTRLGEGKGVEMEKDGFGLLGRNEC